MKRLFSKACVVCVLSLFCFFGFCGLSAATTTSKKLASKSINATTPMSFNNYLSRAYVSGLDSVHIDPFSGATYIHMPLISVPLNDGLSLSVVVADNVLNSARDLSSSTASNTQIFSSFAGSLLRLSPGVTTSWNNTGPHANYPLFMDELGRYHQFYPSSTNASVYYSADGWKASLTSSVVLVHKHLIRHINSSNHIPTRNTTSLYQGTIYSPSGVQYTIASGMDYFSPVTKITSTHGGASINYAYDKNGLLDSITANDGYSVSFSYKNNPLPDSNHHDARNGNSIPLIDTMTTSDKHTYQFKYYQDELFSATYGMFLSSVTLPDARTWSITLKHIPLPAGAGTGIGFAIITTPAQLRYTLTQSAEDVPTGSGTRFNGNGAGTVACTQLEKSGPNIPDSIWTYTYSGASDNPTTTTISSAQKTITDTFHNVYTAITNDTTYQGDWNNGLLLTQGISAPSSVARISSLTHSGKRRVIRGQPGESTTGNNTSNALQTTTYTWQQSTVDPAKTAKLPELSTKVINRDGVDYSSTYTYDTTADYGNPLTLSESSAQGSLLKSFIYDINPDSWFIALQNSTLSDSTNNVVSSTYRTFNEANELLNKTTDGVATTYTYDTGGNINTITDALNHQTILSNYVAGFPESITDKRGNTTTYVVALNGTVTSKTDALSHTTSYTYDSLNRLAGITPPLNAATNIVWNKAVTTQDSKVATRGDRVDTTIYNAFEKPSMHKVTDTAHTKDARTVQYQYDGSGRLVYKSYPNSMSGISYTYDPLDRLTSVIQNAGGNGAHPNTTYTTTYTYGPGNVVTITDPLGHITTKAYRSFGNPDQTQLISQTNPNHQSITFTRNLLGQLLSASSMDFSASYRYDAHHYLTAAILPSGMYGYGRDILGHMTSKQINTGDPVKYTYDPNGNLTNIDYNQETKIPTSPIVKTYDALNRLTGVQNANANYTYQYDANGNLTKTTLVATNQDKNSKIFKSNENYTWIISKTYDELDHLATKTYPDGAIVTYNPNVFGQPTMMAPFIRDIAYYPNGLLQGYTDEGGVITAYHQNDRLIPDKISITGSTNQDIGEFDYTYDADNNVRALNIGLTIPNQNESIYYDQQFSYNDMNWLTGDTIIRDDQLNRTHGTSNTTDQIAFGYDPNGNLVDKKDNETENVYTYKNNLLVDSDKNPITYDASGDIAQLGKDKKTNDDDLPIKSTYDEAHLLVHMTRPYHSQNDGDTIESDNAYDGFGLPVFGEITKTFTNHPQNDTNFSEKYTFFNQSGQQAFTYSWTDLSKNDTPLLIDFAYLQGKLIFEQEHEAGKAPSPQSVAFLHDDLLGNPWFLTAPTGQIGSYWATFDPYGTDHIAARNLSNVGYLGKPFVALDDNVMLGARVYKTGLAHFRSPDPLGPSGINFDHGILNLYGYGNNNPYKYMDPMGLYSYREFEGELQNTADAFTAFGVGVNETLGTAAVDRALGAGSALNVARPYQIDRFAGVAFGMWASGASSATKSVAAELMPVGRGVVKSGGQIIKNTVIGLKRIGSALKSDPYHNFPDIVDNFAHYGSTFKLESGANLTQAEGSLNGVSGRFEWIEQNNFITHRMFVKNGITNGVPITS